MGVLVLLSALSQSPALALPKSTPSIAEHHHHDDAPAPGEKLGQVSFPTTCASRSQPAMERRVALLHSFGYTIAQMRLAAAALTGLNRNGEALKDSPFAAFFADRPPD
jgi:hypothetical protein